MNAPMMYDLRTGAAAADREISRPRLTYYPAAIAPAAAVLVLPGGGYHTQAPHESEPIARWLNRLGLAGFVLDYRVEPDRHPAPLVDAKAAMRFIRRHDGIDPDRVAVLGFSAGGHLAATLSVGTPTPDATDDTRPDLAVLCYPVITFLADSGSMRNLLGPDPRDTDRELLSPERHVDDRTPPTFLWHTADDEAVEVRNSFLYGTALAEREIPFEMHIFPHGKHGLGLAPEDPAVGQWPSLCAQWLAGHGWVLPESATAG
ncbi:MAG TPA: alpha/beta hydrolase [Mycobacteriales bacterium]|nr:alpha/beta hydrolase [Mycobacteriales bacterium]